MSWGKARGSMMRAALEPDTYSGVIQTRSTGCRWGSSGRGKSVWAKPETGVIQRQAEGTPTVSDTECDYVIPFTFVKYNFLSHSGYWFVFYLYASPYICVCVYCVCVCVCISFYPPFCACLSHFIVHSIFPPDINWKLMNASKCTLS